MPRKKRQPIVSQPIYIVRFLSWRRENHGPRTDIACCRGGQILDVAGRQAHCICTPPMNIEAADAGHAALERVLERQQTRGKVKVNTTVEED